MIITKKLFMSEYLESFNYVQTIVILVYKQINSLTFKSKITYKLLIYKHMFIQVCGNKWAPACLKILSTNYALTNHIYVLSGSDIV